MAVKSVPTSLLSALDDVVELIYARSELVVASAPLPFGPDSKYVPISDTIRAVQEALEDLEGPQIVSLYGEPGLGKSSLAKYVALHYEKQSMDRSESTQCS